MQQPDSTPTNLLIPEPKTSQHYRSAIEQHVQSDEISYTAQRDLMQAVDAYLDECLAIHTAILLHGDQYSLESAFYETRTRLGMQQFTSAEEMMDRVCADIVTRTSIAERYREIRLTARTLWEVEPPSSSPTKVASPDSIPDSIPSLPDKETPVSDLWNTTAPPPVRPQFNQVKAVLIVAAIAILAIGAFNVFSASHSPRPVPSTLKLQQLQQLQAAIPAPVDPDAFNEDRDGSNALSLEDENGKATIWQDTTTGSRIFCLDSCMVLPAAHHHHHISKPHKP